MRVLIACELSGIAREAFAARGHDAWSCDLLPTERPGQHIRGDVLEILDDEWDLMIAHPPCNDICVSGNAHAAAKIADGRRQRAIDFFMRFTRLKCKRVVIESSVGIMSTLYRKPDQYIQPHQYGHPESKNTCLWIKGDLSLLVPTNVLDLPECGYWENQTPSGQNKLGPSANRSKLRAKTYQGIADAMAEQWG